MGGYVREISSITRSRDLTLDEDHEHADKQQSARKHEAAHGRNPRGASTFSKEDSELLYALVIFIGAHVYTIDKDLTWEQCQYAVSVSVDSDTMECVRDQEI